MAADICVTALACRSLRPNKALGLHLLSQLRCESPAHLKPPELHKTKLDS
jgi:hypothetical protein